MQSIDFQIMQAATQLQQLTFLFNELYGLMERELDKLGLREPYCKTIVNVIRHAGQHAKKNPIHIQLL